MFFLELTCFLYGPTNTGNLTSGSSASSKPSLYIWNFSVLVQLKPSLKDFEYNLASMGNGWGNSGNSERIFWGAPKSLQMVTPVMKLKDACFLEEKL